MKKVEEFDFSRARRATPQEILVSKKAIERTLHVKRPVRGHPPKGPYLPPILRQKRASVVVALQLEAKSKGLDKISAKNISSEIRTARRAQRNF